MLTQKKILRKVRHSSRHFKWICSLIARNVSSWTAFKMEAIHFAQIRSGLKQTAGNLLWLKLSLCVTLLLLLFLQSVMVIITQFQEMKSLSESFSCLSVSFSSHRSWVLSSKLFSHTIREWEVMTKAPTSTAGWHSLPDSQTSPSPKFSSTQSISTFLTTGPTIVSPRSRKTTNS